VTRRVAVTGASGFIGRHLVERLAALGDAVRAIHRPDSRRSAPAGAAVVRAPLEVSALTEAFRGVDVVVHLAGVVSATRTADFFDVNVRGTRAVAQAARAAGARLVHISSLAAAGPAPPTAPRSEDDRPAPITPYGDSKLEGERVVAATQGLAWTILRPGIVYGPGDRALLPLFKWARIGVMPLVGRASAAYSIVHVSDLVRTIEAAIASGSAGDTLFVGHPEPASARALLERVRDAVGGAALVVPVPDLLLRRASLAGDVGGAIRGRPLVINRRRYAELASEGFVCRVDRLREHLGVTAQMDLSTGLAQTAEWYREAGWL
jgi:nucleoside-diphosphate-sugar epimerase